MRILLWIMFGIVAFITILTLLAGFTGLLIMPLEAKNCRSRWASFENKYTFWGNCQIKVSGKWIPASSYYYKEEK